LLSTLRRMWEADKAQGICCTPASVQVIPDFPILAAAWDARNKHLICGGGGGSTTGGGSSNSDAAAVDAKPKNAVKPGFSFVGTPIHVVDCSGQFA
jgi:hypothetical protein